MAGSSRRARGVDVALRVESAEASARDGRSVEAAEGFLAASRFVHGDEAALLRLRAADQLLTAGHRERGRRILDEQLERLGLSIPSTDTGRVLGLVRETVGRRLDRLRPRATPTSEPRLVGLWAAFRAALAVEPLRAASIGACLVREAERPGATAHARLTAAFVESTVAVSQRGPEGLPQALSRLALALADRDDPRLVQLHAFGEGVVASLGLAFQESTRAFERAIGFGDEHGLGLGFEEVLSRCLAHSNAFVLGDVAYVRARVDALAAELRERDHLLGWVFASIYQIWLAVLERGPGSARAQLEEVAARWTSRGLELQG